MKERVASVLRVTLRLSGCNKTIQFVHSADQMYLLFFATWLTVSVPWNKYNHQFPTFLPLHTLDFYGIISIWFNLSVILLHPGCPAPFLPIIFMDSTDQCLGRYHPACCFCKGKMTQPSPLLSPKPWATWFNVPELLTDLGLIYGVGRARKRNLLWLFSLIFPSQQETKTQCVRIATKGKRFIPPSKVAF